MQADRQATPEQIKAAQLDVSAKDQAIGFLGLQQGLLNDQANNNAQQQALQERSLRVKQGADRRAADFAFAETLTPIQRRRAERQIRDQVTGGNNDRFSQNSRDFIDSTKRSRFDIGDGRSNGVAPLPLPAPPRVPPAAVPAPVSPLSQAQSKPIDAIASAVDAIKNQFSKMKELFSLVQNNSITNQFGSGDVGSGNFQKTIEQQILETQYSVAQRLLGAS